MGNTNWQMKVPDFDYNGKIVVITGSTKGIGKAIAYAYAQCGANVVISGRKQAECDAIAEDIRGLGGQALGCQCGRAEYRSDRASG